VFEVTYKPERDPYEETTDQPDNELSTPTNSGYTDTGPGNFTVQ